MNLEEAIKTALEFEHQVRDVYYQEGAKLTSPVAKKIFADLGEEEQGHVDYLNHKLKEWEETGKVTEEKLDTIVPDVAAIEAGMKNLKKNPEGQILDEEINSFKKALEMEVKASNFFKELMEKLPEENKPLFRRFMEIEEGHEAIVKAELDAAQGLGYWFDMQEFNLEAG